MEDQKKNTAKAVQKGVADKEEEIATLKLLNKSAIAQGEKAYYEKKGENKKNSNNKVVVSAKCRMKCLRTVLPIGKVGTF